MLSASIKSKEVCGFRAIHPCPEETGLFAQNLGKWDYAHVIDVLARLVPCLTKIAIQENSTWKLKASRAMLRVDFFRQGMVTKAFLCLAPPFSP
jgi:hypothetical protein